MNIFQLEIVGFADGFVADPAEGKTGAYIHHVVSKLFDHTGSAEKKLDNRFRDDLKYPLGVAAANVLLRLWLQTARLRNRDFGYRDSGLFSQMPQFLKAHL